MRPLYDFLNQKNVSTMPKKKSSGKYTTVSCGHTKAEAKSKVNKLHKDGFKARRKKNPSGKGFCVLKGGKLK